MDKDLILIIAAIALAVLVGTLLASYLGFFEPTTLPTGR